MGERLRLLRGTLEAGVRGERWVVVADLPLETDQTDAPGSAAAPNAPSAPDPQKADR
jgi:hypothetical protein